MNYAAMRERYSIINVTSGLIGQILFMLLSFGQRMIFIHFFSEEYLGVNGLFTNILSVLGMAELGIGSTMVYSMYRPAAQEDREHITRLMNLYRLLYRWVAAAVAVLGLLLFPFLDFLVGGETEIPNLRLIYLLYLTDDVSSYFLSYKNSVLAAHQRSYYRVAVYYVCHALRFVLQTVILFITGNFILFLIIQLLTQLAVNLIVARKADRDYPYLKSGRELPDREERRSIAKNVRAMCVHTVSGTVKNSTDNILISSFVGLTSVGLFSNYQLIYFAAKSLIEKVYMGFDASIGNLGATESGEKVYGVFKNLDFFVFVLFGYAAVGLFVMCGPFIELTFGKKYLLSISVSCLMAMDFYLTGVRQIMLEFRTALGLFRRDKFKSVAESIINLAVSLSLVGRYGIEGVLIGTVVSTLTICAWVDPYIFMRYGIRDGWKRKLRDFFLDSLIRFFSVVTAGGLSYVICQNIAGKGVGWFLLKCCICTVVYAVVILVMFSRRGEFKYLMNYTLNFVKMTIRKVRRGRNLG